MATKSKYHITQDVDGTPVTVFEGEASCFQDAWELFRGTLKIIRDE